MKGYLRIICANAAVSAVREKGTALLEILAADGIVAEEAVSYWKEPACTVLGWHFASNCPDMEAFSGALAQFSPGAEVRVCPEDSGVEIACYQPLSAILENRGLFFAECFLTQASERE